MENPKVIHRALVTLTLMSGIGAAVLSIYLWNVLPVMTWGLFIVGFAVASVIVAVIYGVTIWPLLLLIGHAFDRHPKTSLATESAEPRAAADHGHDTTGQNETHSKGRDG